MPDYRTMNDGCYGDSEGLATALGTDFTVIEENYDDSSGYGHHSANAIFRRADGVFIHAECGGCSCEGSGSWSFEADEDRARRLIPEQERRS